MEKNHKEMLPVESLFQPTEIELSPSQRVFRSLANLLITGAKRDRICRESAQETTPFFKDTSRDFEAFSRDSELLGRIFHNNQVGFVQKGEIFTTTRDAFEKGLKAPKITGREKNGQAQIVISSNQDAGTPFNQEVLPGIKRVVLKAGGGITGTIPGNKTRELSPQEKADLTGILNQVEFRAQGALSLAFRKASKKPLKALSELSPTIKDEI